MTKQTISVNGTVYDAQTGMPLRVERGNAITPRQHNARHMHTQPQRSKTLNRKYVRREAKEPAPKATNQTTNPTIITRPKPVRAPATTQSEQITHFTKPTPKQITPVTVDLAPTKHHLAERASIRMSAKRPAERMVKPSQVLKQEAISQASAKMQPKSLKKDIKPAKKHRSIGRFLSIASASLAILVLGGYLTYLNMPALSTRVAASQAGISASYPSYQPSGYSLNGPITYQQGSVTMKFAANGGPQNFTLSQTRSDWDSSAVLENYVSPQAGKNYTTTTTGGLTIYAYGSNAVWVNNGILYTISGNATLSGDQIQRIATSL